MASIAPLTTTSTLSPHLPYDEKAEQAVLGAMLCNQTTIPVVMNILSPSDYYFNRNAEIHRAIGHLFATDSPVDDVTVGNTIDKDRDYISTLADSCPTTSNAAYYAKLVRDHSLIRSVILAGNEIAEMGYQGKHDAKTLIDLAEQRIFSVDPPESERSITDMAELTARFIEELQEKKPPKVWGTGFGSLDDVLGGLRACALIVIGARPGIGKTALSLNIARHVSQQGKVLFFSLEMSAEELAERYLCATAHVRLRALRERTVTPDQQADLYKAQALAAQSKFVVIDDPRTTLVSLKATARRQKAKHDLALIIVDYLQLLTLGSKSESRYAEVSTISRELKTMARTLDVPVLALSQLNRESQSFGSDGKPQLSHLRESGSIEQDADVVMLMSWPKDRKGYVLVNVAKNRHGPLEEVELEWIPQYMRFSA